jgi:hypothetical protein
VEITMHPASCQPRTITQPHGGTVVTFVDVDDAAALLSNFIAALDADQPTQREAFMAYARARAERQLAEWGRA